jgi:hypothetical protein
MRITMTEELARAAATDAGNRSMRANSRTKWNQQDYNAAAIEFRRLWKLNEPMMPRKPLGSSDKPEHQATVKP